MTSLPEPPDYSELSLDRNLLTFPIYAPLPPVCFHSGRTDEIEYVWHDFEYLPGTAPGGAEPKVKKIKIRIPLSKSKARRKALDRTLYILSFPCNFLILVDVRIVSDIVTNDLLKLLVMAPACAFQSYFIWKYWIAPHAGFECMKIEGEEGVERVTLQIISRPATEALRAFLDRIKAWS